ncbi:MAG: CarD family transcriptional regulator [Acidobacteria bacterium]|nr:CarD family transcriptional regulator [Acidobacteriota bacterium]
MEFKIGEKVVYPNHGIGVIESIQDAGLSAAVKFYRLRLLANDSTVMVPMANSIEVGLRRVVSKKEITAVFGILRGREIALTRDWKGRYQENSDKMRTGAIQEVAAVLKCLTLLSHRKSLSYRERRMLDKARYLIVSEIAEVEQLPSDKVEARVDRAVRTSIRSEVDH